MNFYPFIRPALFAMDAETAHHFTLRILARLQNTPLQACFAQTPIHDPVVLAGLHFPNRVGLAAGLDKNAQAVDAFTAMGFGFVEVGTVTPKPQDGNPKPRMFRLPKAHALVNRLGFNNAGLSVFLDNLQRSKIHQERINPTQATETIKNRLSSRPLLGLNIGKNATTPIEQAANDYIECLKSVYAYADYVTVNISSPNTQNLRHLQSDAALVHLLMALQHTRLDLMQHHDKCVPIFIKIAPDLDEQQIHVIANVLQKHANDGTWGVIVSNTTIDKSTIQHLPHAQETGGLSGAPVFEKSNTVIRQLRQTMGPSFPIIGVGGILSGADAVQKIQAGADVVQLYTGLIYKGAVLVTDVACALQKHHNNI